MAQALQVLGEQRPARGVKDCVDPHASGQLSYCSRWGYLGVNEHLVGTFTFAADELPEKDWIQSARITKNASEMLINALQGRDEFAELKQRLGNNKATLQPSKSHLVWPAAAAPELEPVAVQIWQFAANGP